MSWQDKAVTLRREWDRGLLSPWNYVGELRAFLTPANIDAVARDLPEPVLEELREVARAFQRNPHQLVQVGRGDPSPDAQDLIATLTGWARRDGFWHWVQATEQIVAATGYLAVIGAVIGAEVGKWSARAHRRSATGHAIDHFQALRSWALQDAALDGNVLHIGSKGDYFIAIGGEAHSRVTVAEPTTSGTAGRGPIRATASWTPQRNSACSAA